MERLRLSVTFISRKTKQSCINRKVVVTRIKSVLVAGLGHEGVKMRI